MYLQVSINLLDQFCVKNWTGTLPKNGTSRTPCWITYSTHSNSSNPRNHHKCWPFCCNCFMAEITQSSSIIPSFSPFYCQFLHCLCLFPALSSAFCESLPAFLLRGQSGQCVCHLLAMMTGIISEIGALWVQNVQ